MTMKKILCLVLALALCGVFAYAEEGDLQTQLDAANARILELEAAVELYKPFYDAQVVAEYNGGVIFLEDVMAEYNSYEQMFNSQYGMSLTDLGMADQYKQMAAESLVQHAVMDMKAAELGLDQLDDETLAGLTAEAEANLESYVASIISYFQGDDVTEEEARTMALEYLTSMGYTKESLLDSIVTAYVDELLYSHATAGITVSDEEVQAAYDELVAEQEASFATDYTYNSTRNSGSLVVWNPEGYRAVKHVLVKFNDEQTTLYSDLSSTIKSLNDELTAAEEGAEGSRSAEEITADIATVQADLDALYAELAPRAQEVVDKFNAGTPFADLIAEYNEDPGMQSEPTATNGYAVAATSSTWDPAFTAGAMSIESVGSISDLVYGQNGIHIICYDADIAAGPVDFETVREEITASTLEAKTSEVYNAALNEWIEAVAPVYHFENLA